MRGEEKGRVFEEGEDRHLGTVFAKLEGRRRLKDWPDESAISGARDGALSHWERRNRRTGHEELIHFLLFNCI